MSKPFIPASNASSDDLAIDVFMSAVERFLPTLTDVDQAAFEQWMIAHADDDDILAHILQTYPVFGEIFADEIERFSTENKVMS